MLIEILAAVAMGSGGAGSAPQDVEVHARVAPRGDYRDSCDGEYVNRGRLYADCRDDRGRIRGTSIELNRCTAYEIRNDDGRLVCGPHRGQYEDRPDRPDRPDGGWDGGWGGGRRDSITLYRDADFRGASFRFDNEIPNLANTGFNDAVSSMRFRGEWEACTDAYYRGQCQTFHNDVRNLRRWGMNDRISSLRPVGRGDRW